MTLQYRHPGSDQLLRYLPVETSPWTIDPPQFVPGIDSSPIRPSQPIDLVDSDESIPGTADDRRARGVGQELCRENIGSVPGGDGV